MALYLLANRLHQMSLAHADAAVQEERVICLRGLSSYRLRSRMSELIARADHKISEGVLLVELRGGVPIETRLRGARSRGRRSSAARGCIGGVSAGRSKGAI